MRGSQEIGEDSNALRILVAFVAIWLLLAMAPYDRVVWSLEHGATIVAVGVLTLTRRSMRFSDSALALIGLFLVLHAIGAHYTYAEVPVGDWLAGHAGRNPYDRLVHLAYGVLMTPAVVELLDARARPVGLWRFLLPVLFVAGTASIYEVLEALALGWVDASAGEVFMAAQGDVWDTQWDMTLAIVGSAAVSALLLRTRRSGGTR